MSSAVHPLKWSWCNAPVYIHAQVISNRLFAKQAQMLSQKISWGKMENRRYLWARIKDCINSKIYGKTSLSFIFKEKLQAVGWNLHCIVRIKKFFFHDCKKEIFGLSFYIFVRACRMPNNIGSSTQASPPPPHASPTYAQHNRHEIYYGSLT